MRLFDTLIDNFSAKDLKTRVTGVIIVGFIVCAGTAAALYFLLTWQQQISVTGMASISPEDPQAIVVSLPPEKLAFLEARDLITVELDDPAEGITETRASVLSINPASPSVTIEAQDVPDAFRSLPNFDVRIILYEEPLWKMLWGKAH